MQTSPVLGLVLALGLSFALMAGAGIGPAEFGENPKDSKAKKTLDEVGNQSEIGDDGEDGGVSADVGGDNEPTLVGFAISGGKFIKNAVGAIALLPITLTRLGFPDYFAFPVGGLAQFIGTVGLYKFVRTGVFD